MQNIKPSIPRTTERVIVALKKRKDYTCWDFHILNINCWLSYVISNIIHSYTTQKHFYLFIYNYISYFNKLKISLRNKKFSYPRYIETVEDWLPSSSLSR